LEHEYSEKDETELANDSKLDWWDGFDSSATFYNHYFRGKKILVKKHAIKVIYYGRRIFAFIN
jgi:hypothetical protein